MLFNITTTSFVHQTGYISDRNLTRLPHIPLLYLIGNSLLGAVKKRFKKAFIRRIDILIIRRLVLITHLSISSTCDIEVEITTPIIATVGEGRIGNPLVW